MSPTFLRNIYSLRFGLGGLLLLLILLGCRTRKESHRHLVRYSPSAAGLVAWWRAEDNANDAVDNHDGRAIGVSYVPGVFGHAFSFVPPRTRVAIPDSPAFQLTSLSIQGWIYPKGAGGIIFFRGDNRVGLDPYSIDMNDSSRPGNVVFTLGDASNTSVHLEAPVQLNQWQHVAATFDGNTGDMKLYVNGALASETSTALRPLTNLDPAHDPGLGIGNTQGTAYDFNFNGYIDEIALYNRALSPAEVISLVHTRR